MEGKSIELVVMIFLLPVIVWFVCRRKRGKSRIRNMSDEKKRQILSELTEPFGFVYEPKEDIFVSRPDAWQYSQGYQALFDELAPKFNMIFDCVPVYFDYKERTWLVEFWKGQYGINTGAEVGVYHSNRVVPKEQRRLIQYNAVSEEEMPFISLRVEKCGEKLFAKSESHWWLAAFRMGVFSEAGDLVMYASLLFEDFEEADAFCQGLKETELLNDSYKQQGNRVFVRLKGTTLYSGRERLHRCIVQLGNKGFCKLYAAITRPFIKTEDRMLFLYEQLPWCFHHMMRLHAFGRRHR